MAAESENGLIELKQQDDEDNIDEIDIIMPGGGDLDDDESNSSPGGGNNDTSANNDEIMMTTLKEESQYPSYQFEQTSMKKIEQESLLADAVQKYPSLYDKRAPSFTRSNDPTQLAWNDVASEFNWILDGPDACRQFEVLKKRYSKKKMNYMKANYFSYSQEYISKNKFELDRYAFLNWLEPHIRYRSAKMNKERSFPNGAVQTEHFNCKNNDCHQDNKRKHDIFVSKSQDNKEGHRTTPVVKKQPRMLLPNPNPPSRPIQIVEVLHSPRNISSRPLQPPNIQVTSNGVDSKDPDDVFLAMVQMQLKALSEREKCMAKHDISSILFKAQLKQLDER